MGRWVKRIVLADYVFWPPKIYVIVCNEQLHFAIKNDVILLI